MTAIALLLFGLPGPGTAALQDPVGDAGTADVPAAPRDTAGAAAADTTSAVADSTPDPAESARRATGTLRALLRGFYGYLPALGIALAILVVAAILARLVRVGLRTALASWSRADAFAAMFGILTWLLALGAAVSVLAGDARALVGSVGLFGLALSWALQTPIESFTGWLLNSFQGYYRLGDRIAVGEVFGDVARIDYLTTTVFEAGGPGKRVQAAQSTGAFITFPNSEVLRANVVNYTRDFPYLWDELTIAVANESDMAFAARRLQEVAAATVGERMRGAAEDYAALLRKARLAWDVATEPEVYASARDAWTDLTIRYMVPARELRKWSSRLLFAINDALATPDAADRIFPAYPRSQVQPIPPPGWAREGGWEKRRGSPTGHQGAPSPEGGA